MDMGSRKPQFNFKPVFEKKIQESIKNIAQSDSRSSEPSRPVFAPKFSGFKKPVLGQSAQPTSDGTSNPVSHAPKPSLKPFSAPKLTFSKPDRATVERLPLKVLQGSFKQVNWGNAVRDRLLAKVDNETHNFFIGFETAKFWIDNEKRRPEELVSMKDRWMSILKELKTIDAEWKMQSPTHPTARIFKPDMPDDVKKRYMQLETNLRKLKEEFKVGA